MRNKMIAWIIVGCGMLGGLWLVPPAGATLLVYEGFNGYSTGSMNGQSVSANTTGLEGSWTSTATFNFDAAGLSFGDLQVNGGSAKSGGVNVGLTADIATGTGTTGTLWGSFLVNLTSVAGNVRVGVGTDDHFKTGPVFGTNAATSYDGVNYSSAAGGSSVATAGTTYIVISKWTNVGAALSGASPGLSNYWMLTLDQFESFVAAGRTETYLATAALGTGTNQVWSRNSTGSTSSGTYLFDDTQVIGLRTGSNFSTETFDEVRYGTTLLDVTPVPEPSVIACLLVAGGGMMLLHVRWTLGRKCS